MLKSMLLLILVALCMLCATTSMRAPDVAPYMPEEWCNDPHSTRTRTTGECICKPSRECQGSRCINDQGFRFYGLDCKDCKCVPVAEEGSSAPPTEGARAYPTSEGVAFPPPEPQYETKEEDTESLMERLDFVMDNLGNYVVAAVVVVGVLVLAVSVFLSSSSPPTKASEEKPKPVAKRAD